MGKAKAKKAVGMPNRHLASRISYLFQAASYLQNSKVENSTEAEHHPPSSATGPNSNTSPKDKPPKLRLEAAKIPLETEGTKRLPCKASHAPLARQLLSQLGEVSLKSQVRLTPDIKRSICRRCHTLLIPGQSSELFSENLSRRASKPWAEVIVVRCKTCQAVKRFPVGAHRPPSGKKKDVLPTHRPSA